MKKRPQKTIEGYPIRRGIVFKSPGPYYGGGTIFYFDKNGRFNISQYMPKKSEVMSDKEFCKKFGVKIIRKLSKRKNPRNLSPGQIYDVLLKNTNLLTDLKRGREGIAYYFNLKKNTFLFDTLFKPGEYAAKIYIDERNYPIFLNEKQQQYLLKLSKYGLIPKIFYLDSNLMIMQYIEGEKIREVLKYHPELRNEIEKKYLHLLEVWKKLGFKHGDILEYEFNRGDETWLKTSNIIVSTKDGIVKLYLIDPFIDNLAPMRMWAA